jgi:subtilisin family serine protease
MLALARVLTGLCLLAAPPSARAAGQDSAEGEVLVVFRPGQSADTARKALGRHALGMDRQFRNVSRQSGRVTGLVRNKALGTARLIERLKADPAVESVEPNYRNHRLATLPNDTDFSKLWGLHNTGQTVNGTAGTSGVDVNFPEAWALARRAPFPEVVVGVVDFGFDITHPDLAANIWTNPGEIAGNQIDDDGNGFTDDIHGYDFGTGSAVIFDYDDHGTHVAGTIAAVGKNQTGVIGAAFRSKILPLKGSDANGDMFDSTTIDAFDYAIALKQRGVNIVAINASYGSTFYSASVFNAIQALRDNGIVLCAAAGNDNSNNDASPEYPASYNHTNIIAVAAHTQTGSRPMFSNYGSTTVDIAAPGDNIYSTRPQYLATHQSSVTIGPSTYAAQTLEYAGSTAPAGISGSIHNCGLGNPGDFPPAVAGNIALIQRGILLFSEKVANAMSAGASAAIIYDNTADPLTTGGWTLGQGLWIPAVRVTRADGLAILASLPANGTVVNAADSGQIYQFLDGTSMAAPHVTAAVAFAAMNFPAETIAQRVSRITGNVTPVPAFAGLMTSGGRLNLLKMIDTEGDGLPDWWETETFGDLTRNATADEDGDGFSNLDEFRTATDPRDAASHLAFTAFTPVEDGGQTYFDLSFPSVEDRRYRVEWSDSLQDGSWLPLGAPLTGTGALLQVRDTAGMHTVPWRFYRLGLLPD